MIFFLYSFLYFLILFFLFPKEFFKRKKNKRLVWLKEKLGFIYEPLFKEKRPIIWVHAVSVGETLAIAPLIKELSKRYNIVLTTITDTGREIAEKRFAGLPVKIYYLPFDLKGPILRFLKRAKPQALLIAETEIWPNLIKVSSEHIPVSLINGRLSEKSFKNYRLFKFFFDSLLNRLSFLALQEEIYAERFKALGVKEEKIKVVGNLKFDLEIPYREFKELENLPSPIIIAGSTHSPEEELILKTFLKVLSKGSLILVPRHPQRFKEVENLILNLLTSLKEEVEFYLYSALKEKNPFFSKERVVLLFDEMGLLGSLYRIGDIAIIGGSFIPHGGQNPLEAIYWKKAVVTGPYMNNFPFVQEFLKEGAILQTNERGLEKTLRELVENEELRKKIGEKAYQLLEKKKGATAKTLTLINSLFQN